jgi:hypothetical protein
MKSLKAKAGSVAMAVVKEYSDVDLVGMMPMFFISDGLAAREQSFDPWNGHPAFFGTFEDKGTHIVNRNVLVGDRLYRIMATMPVRAAETERVYVEKFFEGFALVPGGS